jgi:hypothetical protein
MLRQGFYIIFCLLLAGAANKVLAQQDAQFSQYMYNSIYVTPAAAGIDGVTKFQRCTEASGLDINLLLENAGRLPTQVINIYYPDS